MQNQDRKGAEKRSRLGRWAWVFIAALLALPLLYLGVNHLMAAWAAEKAASVVARAEKGLLTTAQQRQAAIDDLKAALDWQPQREYHFDIAMLEYMSSKQYEHDSQQALAARASAVKHQRLGLRLAPIEPTGWTQLGWYLERDDKPRQALAALRQSTLLAAYAPEHQWWRTELWLVLNSEFGPGDYGMFRRQLAFAFDTDAARLAELAEHYGMKAYVRQSLIETAGIDRAVLAEHFSARPTGD